LGDDSRNCERESNAQRCGDGRGFGVVAILQRVIPPIECLYHRGTDAYRQDRDDEQTSDAHGRSVPRVQRLTWTAGDSYAHGRSIGLQHERWPNSRSCT